LSSRYVPSLAIKRSPTYLLQLKCGLHTITVVFTVPRSASLRCGQGGHWQRYAVPWFSIPLEVCRFISFSKFCLAAYKLDCVSRSSIVFENRCWCSRVRGHGGVYVPRRAASVFTYRRCSTSFLLESDDARRFDDEIKGESLRAA
jgi:hypothetical protein